MHITLCVIVFGSLCVIVNCFYRRGLSRGSMMEIREEIMPQSSTGMFYFDQSNVNIVCIELFGQGYLKPKLICLETFRILRMMMTIQQ